MLAFLLAIVVGIPIGRDRRAYARTRWLDYTAMFFSNVGFAVPSFLVATLLIYYVALQWGARLPTSGWRRWEQKMLPVFALGLLPMAYFARLVRGHDARDAPAGLHPHREGEGPALAPRRRACTCSATR